MITVLFGQPHSGKTTLASKMVADHYIDGDELRKIFNNTDYSKEGRIKNLNRASDIAVYLDGMGLDVVVSLMYPYVECRNYLNSLNSNVNWIHLFYNEDIDPRGREKFHLEDFRFPSREDTFKRYISINTSNVSIDGCIKLITEHINNN